MAQHTRHRFAGNRAVRRLGGAALLLPVIALLAGEGAAPQSARVGVPPGVDLARTPNLVVTEPGTVIDSLEVNGYIAVMADDVTIQRTRVLYGGTLSIRIAPGVRGTILKDSEIRCQNAEGTNGIAYGNYIALRVDATGCRNSFVYSKDRPATIIDSRTDGRLINVIRPIDRISGHSTAITPSSTPSHTYTSTPAPKATPAATVDPSPTTATPSPSRTTHPPRHDTRTGSPPAGNFPTMENTGPRLPISSMRPSHTITTDRNGQLIENLEVTGAIRVVHDDVVVRNVRVNHTTSQPGVYALHVGTKPDGSCPSGTVFEYLEVVGEKSSLADSAIAVYSPCPFTLRNSRIYDVGNAIRLGNGSRIEHNYIRANHYNPGSGSHRSGLGLNGGAGNSIIGNDIECAGEGCSGALVMYGDFSQIRDIRIEGNLLNTTGSYCTYAGSIDSKRYPIASNVHYIGNYFGRKFYPTCGIHGPVAGRDQGGGPGFIWRDNVWADTGEPVE